MFCRHERSLERMGDDVVRHEARANRSGDCQRECARDAGSDSARVLRHESKRGQQREKRHASGHQDAGK